MAVFPVCLSETEPLNQLFQHLRLIRKALACRCGLLGGRRISLYDIGNLVDFEGDLGDGFRLGTACFRDQVDGFSNFFCAFYCLLE